MMPFNKIYNNLLENFNKIIAINYFSPIIAICLIANYKNPGPDPLQLSRCHCNLAFNNFKSKFYWKMTIKIGWINDIK